MIVTNRKADITMVIYMNITSSFRYVNGVNFMEEGFSFLFYKSQNWYIIRRNDKGSHAKRYFFSNLSKNQRTLKEKRYLGSGEQGNGNMDHMCLDASKKDVCVFCLTQCGWLLSWNIPANEIQEFLLGDSIICVMRLP